MNYAKIIASFLLFVSIVSAIVWMHSLHNLDEVPNLHSSLYHDTITFCKHL